MGFLQQPDGDLSERKHTLSASRSDAYAYTVSYAHTHSLAVAHSYTNACAHANTFPYTYTASHADACSQTSDHEY